MRQRISCTRKKAGKVGVVSSRQRYRQFEPEILRAARGVLRAMRSTRDVEIALVTDRKIRALNRIYRHKDCATDVLSFSFPRRFIEGGEKGQSLGEVYLAPDYCAREERALEPMLVHSMLHLFGYNHDRNRDTISMDTKARLICRALHIEQDIF